ncbi:hypothetical protein B0H14DRAFT_2523730 [Mycena olivaceomarginata]|nr:hypothetical protein B0H14DRAFT_2523730 [Mycena olivaceomarginata]
MDPRPDRWQEKPQPRLSLEEREKLILSIPDAESARAASKEYTAHAHPAGSAYDEQDALRMLKFFQEELQIPPSEAVFDAGSKESRWATLGLTNALFGPRGPTAWVDTYYPVMDTGVEQRLEILGKDGSTVWTADLVEDGDPLDPDAHKHRDSVPTWHGASGDGDVEGQLIYANYGTRADYLDLVAAGANLTGKVVITRYRGVLRGLKIRGVEDLGAVGVLMYDDPRDDDEVVVPLESRMTYPPTIDIASCPPSAQLRAVSSDLAISARVVYRDSPHTMPLFKFSTLFGEAPIA